jgi:hypothetical protein
MLQSALRDNAGPICESVVPSTNVLASLRLLLTAGVTLSDLAISPCDLLSLIATSSPLPR